MIFSDFIKAIGQVGDPAFLSVLARGIGLTVGLLFAFTAAFMWLVTLFTPGSILIPLIGEITWMDNVISLAVIPVMLFASIFLMVPVASAFTGLFLDEIVDAVEAQHYPSEPPVARISLAENLIESFKFLGLVIGVNMLALLFYLTPLAPFVFWGVNGILLGREYGLLVARRRLGEEEARTFRKNHRFEIWFAGILMAVPLTIPVFNLLVPILGVAAFTHLFHRLNRRV